ncbi:hypothetical protein PCANC_03217 [Puccinia coronata f. sp. avenae]|uniref:Uncharacterized protein n=1 Tax=Puccinia coronata f. sp. avenae TaxID=200324 RepID=A0A2N5T841_9BASI|nr:hypothetical protein PCANC_03217 [Puccinia coronata f. sp. avenae]
MRPLSMRISNIWSRILGLNDLSDAQSDSHKVSQGCLLSLACAAGLEGTKALRQPQSLGPWNISVSPSHHKVLKTFHGLSYRCGAETDKALHWSSGGIPPKPTRSNLTLFQGTHLQLRVLSASRQSSLGALGEQQAGTHLLTGSFGRAGTHLLTGSSGQAASRFFLLDLLSESSGQAGVYLRPGSFGQAGALGEQVRTCSLGAPGEQVCTFSLRALGKQVRTCSLGPLGE